MKKSAISGIKARGMAFSFNTSFCLILLYFGANMALIVLLLPLLHFFPALNEYAGWLIQMPYILVAVGLLYFVLLCSNTVILTPDTVYVKRFGMVVRSFPVSSFRLFCAVGNGREVILCLSRCSSDELVQMQEKRLLRSALNKHNVPLLKQSENWRDVFAQEYINHLRMDPFRALKQRDFVMLEMHAALQYSIQKMYPQLPYRNYTGINTRHVPRFSIIEKDRVASFALLFTYKFSMENDGIHIISGKEELFCIPAQQIKTAVRVDVFQYNEKDIPHHMPLLYVTAMTETELASHPATESYGSFCLHGVSDQALLAMTAATYLARRWDKRKNDSCVLHHTHENLEMLQTLYPHIHINEIGANWLDDTEGSVQ